MNRYFNSFLIALTLHSSVFGLIIYQSSIDNFSDKKHPHDNACKMYVTVIKEQVPTKEDAPKVENEVKQKKVEKKKVVKKTVKKELLQKPQPILEAAKSPITEEIKEVEEAVDDEPKAPLNPNQHVQKIVNTSIAKTADTDLLKAKQDKFLAYLVEKINANKSYPNIARRRVVEGNVEVKFHVSADGSVGQIQMVSGNNIFKKSAIEAITKSFPIELDRSLFDFPKEFKITIAYILK